MLEHHLVWSEVVVAGHLVVIWKKIHFLVICPPRWTGVVCRQNEKRARVIHPRIIEKTVWLTLQMLIYYFGWKKLQKWAKSKKSIFWSNRPLGWSRVVMAYFYVRTSSSVVRGGRGSYLVVIWKKYIFYSFAHLVGQE